MPCPGADQDPSGEICLAEPVVMPDARHQRKADPSAGCRNQKNSGIKMIRTGRCRTHKYFRMKETRAGRYRTHKSSWMKQIWDGKCKGLKNSMDKADPDRRMPDHEETAQTRRNDLPMCLAYRFYNTASGGHQAGNPSTVVFWTDKQISKAHSPEGYVSFMLRDGYCLSGIRPRRFRSVLLCMADRSVRRYGS